MPSSVRSRTLLISLFCALVTSVTLLPWLRNHDYIRDFYDYGLFINVNARLDAGQRPFTDFTTPAQSATFLLNHVAERLGGGTYVGMTYGAAAVIVVASIALFLMLARRLPLSLAALVAGAIVACSASQHTIVFYNPLGVLAMALVVWSFAVAPLLDRKLAGWHAVAAAGLVLGGLNKINFHLLSLALAIGWVVWAVLVTRPSAHRVVATLGFIIVFGLVVPISLEIAWTGSGWRTWFYNVVELPLKARGDRISMLQDPRLYFTTVHDYYGPMRVPQAGLAIVLIPLFGSFAAWFAFKDSGAGLKRTVAALAGLCGSLAGAALLLTNNEIAYLTLAASLVMLAALWLGFRLPGRGAWPVLALGLPAAFLGFCGWESAYQGQRSQFGHSGEPRAEYRRGETIGPEFEYLRGLRLPNQIAVSLEGYVHTREMLGADANRVFYGPGSEWLERIWPSPKVPGLPLVVAAFDSAQELAMVRDQVMDGGLFSHILVVEAWNWWPPSLREPMARRYSISRAGPIFLLYRRLPAAVLSTKPLEFSHRIGGNVDSNLLHSKMEFYSLSDGRKFVGVTRGVGELDLAARSNRASGVAVLKRTHPGSGPLAEPVRFDIYATGDGMRLPRWSRELTLAEGEDEIAVPTDRLDASGLNLAFVVSIPDAIAGTVVAGWREPQLWDTLDSIVKPPLLQETNISHREAEAELRAALLPPGMEDAPVYVRGAEYRDGRVWLPPRAEVWIRLTGRFASIAITTHAEIEPPYVRALYYKGGRMETFEALFDEANRITRFRAWSPESGGWLAVISPPHLGSPPCTVRVESAERP